MWLLLLALALVALALFLLHRARRMRAGSGLPPGRVVYVDSRRWQTPPYPLRAPRYGLVGRPDYLLHRGRAVIPVEVKPGRTPAEPYEADVWQLGAYCLLVEAEYGTAPPHGLLIYPERAWEIPFTPELRRRLLEVLSEMRAAGRGRPLPRSHDQPARCAACAMRNHCGEEALD
ncbi:MAG: CRISPR-associated protein Cas4 [Chloroflexia bacterium]